MRARITAKESKFSKIPVTVYLSVQVAFPAIYH